MSRHGKHKFDFSEYASARTAFAKNERVLYWLSDDESRNGFYAHLRAASSPPFSFPALKHSSQRKCGNHDGLDEAGHANVVILAHPDDIQQALTSKDFSNSAYSEIGNGSFMLALDPELAANAKIHHRLQRKLAHLLLPRANDPSLGKIIDEACRSAELTSLRSAYFDLAHFTEQAALRFVSLLFGYRTTDYSALEAAMRSAYRSLTYEILGRHFVGQPLQRIQANRDMGELFQRTVLLIREYREREFDSDTGWEPPEHVEVPTHLTDWQPIMRRLARSDELADMSADDLGGFVVGMMAGTVGNVQAGVCIAVEGLLSNGRASQGKDDVSWDLVVKQLLKNPPVAFLPRKVVAQTRLKGSGTSLLPGSECILAIGAAMQGLPEPQAQALLFGLHSVDSPAGGCPAHATSSAPDGIHSCVGRFMAQTLITHLVRTVLSLPELDRVLDPETGEGRPLEKEWGFRCVSFPLRYKRADRMRQQTLNVTMRVKSPISENAQKLRAVIRNGAPRIERALRASRHVHFAWFEFIEHDSCLVLHTVYDGDFDAYVQYFALEVHDLFDLLFTYIEDAPPLPVKQYPDRFVDRIRSHNRMPAEGYLFSAYPHLEVPRILHALPGKP